MSRFSPPGSSLFKRVAILLVVLLAAGVASAIDVSASTVSTANGDNSSSSFEEVGRVPLTAQGYSLIPSTVDRSGWLILNPKTRRGYQIFEWAAAPSQRPSTVVQSFDLDTLELGRVALLGGVPVTSGTADVAAPETTVWAGDIVHAVDEESGRIYLALSDQGSLGVLPTTLVAGVGPPADGQRPWSRIVAIDEARFNSGAGDFLATFREPADQARLHAYWIMGLKVRRDIVARSEPGRLLALFAQPSPLTGIAPVHDHTLAEWDPANLNWDDAAAFASDVMTPFPGETIANPSSLTASPLPVKGDWARRLEVCAQASLASAGAAANGNLQWGILVTKAALYTACQQRQGVGAVVRVGLQRSGRPSDVGDQTLFPLSSPISDVLADDGGGRLLVKTFGNGNTVWVFDTASGRFTGSIGAKLTDGFSMAMGIDSSSGRLYTLLPDHLALERGRNISVRGGLHYSDTRLDPAPPLANAVPSLAHTGWWRIAVDPVTRRVYVRRGHNSDPVCVVYPGTQPDTPCPPERFWRVLEDKVPHTERPQEEDDARFTTDVQEDPSLTKASYLGTGSGFGTRALLIGGFGSATNTSASPCSGDDRELLAGSVGSVGVSDFAIGAEAASLDADIRTRDLFGKPLKGCVDPRLPRDTGEVAFDESKDPGKDCAGGPVGCTVTEGGDRTGGNGYAASCVGTGTDEPGEIKRTVSRKQFTSKAVCNEADERAEGSATGSFFVPTVDDAQSGAGSGVGTLQGVVNLPAGVPGETLKIAYSSSTATVDRNSGSGVKVTVDSIARGVEIPGVGRIGILRTEATSVAGGRRGTAKATFRRWICGVELPDMTRPDCLSEDQQTTFVKQLNDALLGQGEARLRAPDERLLAGSETGYQAGVQRDRRDGFGDRTLAKDFSLAVPALELILYRQGGRQIFQFAASQAGSSYGIACLYGQAGGRCAREGDTTETPTLGASEGGGAVTVVQESPGQVVTHTKPESTIMRILKAIPRAIAEVLRLLFNSPRELGLMAAVWSLLYAPCYLAERRRNIRALRTRRTAVGGFA